MRINEKTDLATKAAMILGVYGAARMDELVNLQFTDVASDGAILWLQYANRKPIKDEPVINLL